MAPEVDVYLLPAVVGGGLGDIEEVLAAGRRLERQGFSSVLYRARGRPLPRSVDGPWDWPATLERRAKLRPRAKRAVTITPSWGLSAAPDRPGPLGRGGVWQEEAASIERTYGRERTVHVSLEEFARIWTSRREVIERYREGGKPARAIRAFAQSTAFAREAERWRESYRRFRELGRPNVVHLYGTFGPDPGFRREFPEAVQCGPLWPGLRGRSRSRARVGPPSCVWYASPASAERLLPGVLEGLRGGDPCAFLWVRSPRVWRAILPGEEGKLVVEPQTPSLWRRRFAGARLRLVTGSRTLLEAIELGGPFLYFNGVIGAGRARRRHRPDKIESLLTSARALRVDPRLVRDLRDFSRGMRVRDVVHHAARGEGAWSRFPSGPWVRGFRAPYDDLGELLGALVRSFSEGEDATALVARARHGSVER